MFNALQYRRRARMLVSQAAEEWFLSIHHLADGTQHNYRRIIRAFALDLPKKYISQIQSADIHNYLNKFAWGRENITVNNHLVALKSYFRFLSKSYGITNIARPLKKRKVKMPYQPFISKKDLDKILLSATQKQADIIRMLAHTGMRCSELAGLRPENIAPNLSSIRIQGKGGRVRTIPCNLTVKEILSRNINFPKNRKNVYNACCKAGISSNISLSPHMLRRLFATTLLSCGTSLLIISRLLGHASIQTTEIYLKLDSSYLSGATDCLD